MLNTNFCLINFLNITIVLNFQQNTAFPVSVSEDSQFVFALILARMHLRCLVGKQRRHTLVNNQPLWALVSPLIDAAPKREKTNAMRRGRKIVNDELLIIIIILIMMKYVSTCTVTHRNVMNVRGWKDVRRRMGGGRAILWAKNFHLFSNKT